MKNSIPENNTINIKEDTWESVFVCHCISMGLKQDESQMCFDSLKEQGDIDFDVDSPCHEAYEAVSRWGD